MDGGLRLLLSQGSGVESRPVSPPLGEGRAPLGGRSGLRKAEKFWARGSGEKAAWPDCGGGAGKAGPWPHGRPRAAGVEAMGSVLFPAAAESAAGARTGASAARALRRVSGAVGRGRPGRASVAVRSLPVLLPGRAQCWGTWASPEGHGVDDSDAPGPRKCPAKVSVSVRVLLWPVDVRLSPQGCRRLGVAPRAGCPWCHRARA